MTEQQFDVFRKRFQRKRFPKRGLGPLTEAILRTKFHREKLKKLIAAAETVLNSESVARKLIRWQKQLARMEATKKGRNSKAGQREIVPEKIMRSKVPPFKRYVSARRIRTE